MKILIAILLAGCGIYDTPSKEPMPDAAAVAVDAVDPCIAQCVAQAPLSQSEFDYCLSQCHAGMDAGR